MRINTSDRSDAAAAREEPQQIVVRLPRAIREAIEADARAQFRSLNMHILFLVQQRLDQLGEVSHG